MFQISDKVVCINDDFSYKSHRTKYYNKLPIRNQIYCIREICYTPIKHLPYIKLVGIWADIQKYKGGFELEPGFDPKRFRKIDYNVALDFSSLSAIIKNVRNKRIKI